VQKCLANGRYRTPSDTGLVLLFRPLSARPSLFQGIPSRTAAPLINTAGATSPRYCTPGCIRVKATAATNRVPHVWATSRCVVLRAAKMVMLRCPSCVRTVPARGQCGSDEGGACFSCCERHLRTMPPVLRCRSGPVRDTPDIKERHRRENSVGRGRNGPPRAVQ